jgi:hypothetical protein
MRPHWVLEMAGVHEVAMASGASRSSKSNWQSLQNMEGSLRTPLLQNGIFYVGGGSLGICMPTVRIER